MNAIAWPFLTLVLLSNTGQTLDQLPEDVPVFIISKPTVQSLLNLDSKQCNKIKSVDKEWRKLFELNQEKWTGRQRREAFAAKEAEALQCLTASQVKLLNEFNKVNSSSDFLNVLEELVKSGEQGLSDIQEEKIQSLRLQFFRQATAAKGQPSTQLEKSLRKDVEKVLLPTQRTRMEQLEWQYYIYRFSFHVFEQSEVQEYLQLNEKQIEYLLDLRNDINQQQDARVKILRSQQAFKLFLKKLEKNQAKKFVDFLGPLKSDLGWLVTAMKNSP